MPETRYRWINNGDLVLFKFKRRVVKITIVSLNKDAEQNSQRVQFFKLYRVLPEKTVSAVVILNSY
jgi:hypothetical protein